MTFQPLGQPGLPASFALPTYRPDRLTHILLGDYAAVIEAINRMVGAQVLRWQSLPEGKSRGVDRAHPHRAQRRIHQRDDPSPGHPRRLAALVGKQSAGFAFSEASRSHSPSPSGTPPPAPCGSRLGCGLPVSPSITSHYNLG
ncbi:MAG: hypothetical protein WBA99_08690 [Nodosilinea sp.]